MAEGKKSGGEGILSFLLKKTLGVVIERILGLVVTVVVILAFLAWVIDVLTANASLETPFGRVTLPHTSILPELLKFVWQLTFGFAGAILTQFWLPAIGVLFLVFLWRFLHWRPEENGPTIWTVVQLTLFSGLLRGGQKAAGAPGALMKRRAAARREQVLRREAPEEFDGADDIDLEALNESTGEQFPVLPDEGAEVAPAGGSGWVLRIGPVLIGPGARNIK